MNEALESADGRVVRARLLREERRSAILDAARAEFASRGYHTVSISDIIEAAGIARGTFYLYFESKRSIFEEIVDELLAQLRASVKRVDVHSDVPPQVQLYQNLHSLLVVLMEHRDRASILLRQAVGLDHDFDQKLSSFYGQLRDLLKSSLLIGMELGLVRQLNPDVVASCIIGSVKEVLATALLEGGGRLPADVPVVVDEILSYNLRGVLDL